MFRAAGGMRVADVRALVKIGERGETELAQAVVGVFSIGGDARRDGAHGVSVQGVSRC